MNEDVRKLIFATLAYYDLFDFPLTADEIKKYLVAPAYLNLKTDVNNDEIDAVLYSLVNTGQLRLLEGFYTFPKRDHIAPLRLRNQRIASGRIKRAKTAAFIMSFFPYVQVVFASGSLALENTDHESDLDIFLITRPGRIWTVRFLANAFFDIIGWKRKPQVSVAPNKLCLNHLIVDDSLHIPHHTIYPARIYYHLAPLYVRDAKILKKFQKENDWMYDYMHSWDFSMKYLIRDHAAARLVKRIGEAVLNSKLGTLAEKLVKKYQVKRIEGNILTRNPDDHIEYDDNRLEFHPNSVEGTIAARYATAIDLTSTLNVLL